MKQKIKAVLRSSSRRLPRASDQSDNPTENNLSDPSHTNHRRASLDKQNHIPSIPSNGDAQNHSCNRPLGSPYNDRYMNGTPGSQPNPHDQSLSNDHNAHLPVLPSSNNSGDYQLRASEAGQQPSTGANGGPYKEAVADRNMDRYKTSLDVPRRKPIPTTNQGATHQDINSNGKLTKPEAGNRESTIAINGRNDIKKIKEQLLDGVVDLRNTIDTDKDIQIAPAVTHEIIKPHLHEITQHKIYREIHNYEYHHHTQPVYDLEVLPPRHYTPSPNGESLVEIPADQIPQRTGANRRWEIVQKHVPLTAETSMPKYRTEPEIIEHAPSVTEEGFERRETTILYPPTIAEMKGYKGLVQPVHFDHKTGKQWLGEIVTMDKLQEQMNGIRGTGSMNMEALGENLPKVPSVR